MLVMVLAMELNRGEVSGSTPVTCHFSNFFKSLKCLVLAYKKSVYTIT